MIRFATAEDIPALKELWMIGFGDPQSYVDLYFSQGFTASDTLMDWEQGMPVAMLGLLPAAYGSLRCGYIYAAATRPAYRRQGRMERLLSFAKAEAASRGWDALLLCPANDALFGYYAKLGYTVLLSHRLISLTSEQESADMVTLCGIVEYAAQRRAQNGLFLSSPYDLYALKEASFTGTRFLRGVDFYAAVQNREDELFVRELLAAPENAHHAVSALAKEADCSRVILRLHSNSLLFPECGGSLEPYAALLPLRAGYPWSEVYTNLLLTED